MVRLLDSPRPQEAVTDSMIRRSNEPLNQGDLPLRVGQTLHDELLIFCKRIYTAWYLTDFVVYL